MYGKDMYGKDVYGKDAYGKVGKDIYLIVFYAFLYTATSWLTRKSDRRNPNTST
jgi:hypothetical protein